MSNVADYDAQEFAYQEIFEELPYLMAILGSDGTVKAANRALVRLIGQTRESLLNCAYWELSCWEHSEDIQNRILFSMEQSAIHGEEVRMETQFRDFLGNLHDIDFHIKVIETDGQEMCFLATGFNVTALVEVRKALSERERQMEALFEYSEEGFFFNVLPEALEIAPDTDHDTEFDQAFNAGIHKTAQGKLLNDLIHYQKVVRFNKAFKSLLGIAAGQNLPTLKLYSLLQIKGRDYRNLLEKLLVEGEVKFEHTLIDAKGSARILQIFMVLIRTKDAYYGNFGVIRDLTIQREYESKLAFLAYKDALTGLNNRRTFFKEAKYHFSKDIKTEDNFSQERRHQSAGAVAMLDIDHFKKVNDTYGHDIGDVVLKEFAGLLAQKSTQTIIVARYGGEEFAVLFKTATVAMAIEWCDDFRISASELIFTATDGSVFQITVSIGLADIKGDELEIDSAITRADKALYASKNTGRNKCTIF